MSKQANVHTAKELGLLEEEYSRICDILGRQPNFTELGIFSVMWSEHCSYKNSIKYLKTLPREGKHLLVEAGEENAGLVDLGDGLGCVFKIESHNHPSALEPYQGAATGVGGIHRDIFTMGARPVAALNSLRFGEITHRRTKHLLRGVVKGIGDYGNCFGVPTVGGEVYFDKVYHTNPLVNAFSAGIVKNKDVVSAISYGEGNLVYIVGSATGKDGIAGASFASKDITEDSANDLPAVQVGDPFQEKLLLEASLELIRTDALIGMQDMGAAGITCSTSEMSAKGEHGMCIYLDKVPTRQKHMKPFEILLSESQERMLIVVKKGHERTVEAIFEKWDLNCVQIGEVIKEERLKYYMNGVLVADVPTQELVLGGGAPVYDRDYKEPSYFKAYQQFDIQDILEPKDILSVAQELVNSPNIASKRWIYQQYDSMVGVNNLSTNHPSDASLVRVKGTNKALALTVDCNARYVHANPYVGTMIAVSEAARNIVCSGGNPSAITNCLNFGNPYNPEVYWQFVEAIRGMGDACRQFDTPVTGGNVSFYNQSTDDGPVFPTPTIGMMGIVPDYSNIMTLDFKKKGDLIYLLGESKNDISSSEYLVRYHKVETSSTPYFDLDTEYILHNQIKTLIKDKHINTAHDISEGGLFIALLESAIHGKLGFDISTDTRFRKDAFLYGEAQSRAIISVDSSKREVFEDALHIPYTYLGRVTNQEIIIDNLSFGNITDWIEKYDTVLNRHLDDSNE